MLQGSFVRTVNVVYAGRFPTSPNPLVASCYTQSPTSLVGAPVMDSLDRISLATEFLKTPRYDSISTPRSCCILGRAKVSDTRHQVARRTPSPNSRSHDEFVDPFLLLDGKVPDFGVVHLVGYQSLVSTKGHPGSVTQTKMHLALKLVPLLPKSLAILPGSASQPHQTALHVCLGPHAEGGGKCNKLSTVATALHHSGGTTPTLRWAPRNGCSLPGACQRNQRQPEPPPHNTRERNLEPEQGSECAFG